MGDLNIKINTSCHTKTDGMTSRSNCFVNGKSECMVRNGVYEDKLDNHIQRAEYFNREAEKACRSLRDISKIMLALKKLEFAINYDCYTAEDFHSHVMKFY